MNPIPGMPQTQRAKDMLYTIEAAKYTDFLDVLDAAEEIARREGATKVDEDHVKRALVALAPKEKS